MTKLKNIKEVLGKRIAFIVEKKEIESNTVHCLSKNGRTMTGGGAGCKDILRLDFDDDTSIDIEVRK